MERPLLGAKRPFMPNSISWSINFREISRSLDFRLLQQNRRKADTDIP
jgi:hypothetical protein